MNIDNKTPSGYVRCTIIDDSDDVITDRTVRDAHVVEDRHRSKLVFHHESAFPDEIQGLHLSQLQWWQAVVTDGDGEVHSGLITDAESLVIVFGS